MFVCFYTDPPPTPPNLLTEAASPTRMIANRLPSRRAIVEWACGRELMEAAKEEEPDRFCQPLHTQWLPRITWDSVDQTLHRSIIANQPRYSRWLAGAARPPDTGLPRNTAPLIATETGDQHKLSITCLIMRAGMQGDQVHVDQLSRPALGTLKGRQVSPGSAAASRRTEQGRGTHPRAPKECTKTAFLCERILRPCVRGGCGGSPESNTSERAACRSFFLLDIAFTCSWHKEERRRKKKKKEI